MFLKESGSNLDVESFLEVENLIGHKLPDEYKEFMLEHNGGRPVNHCSFSFKEKNPETNEIFENTSDIYSFNKIEDIPIFYDNLVSAEVISKYFCPIADDSCGNEILICLSNSSDYGKIMFADHELYESDESWTLSYLANSFNDFIKMLKIE